MKIRRVRAAVFRSCMVKSTCCGDLCKMSLNSMVYHISIFCCCCFITFYFNIQRVILHSVAWFSTHPHLPRLSSHSTHQPTHPHLATVQLFTRGYEVTNHSSLPFNYSREPRSEANDAVPPPHDGVGWDSNAFSQSAESTAH